jgi:polysaccharide pyruvyl transferase WcaK-like protein
MRAFLIADIGGDSTYHVGDEAMLAVDLEILRRKLPDADFSILSRDPGASSQRYGVDSLPYLGFPEGHDEEPRRKELFTAVSQWKAGKPFDVLSRQTLEAVANSDVVVLAGGGNLSSSWPHHLYERVALLTVAHNHGRRIVVSGQTLGPYLEPHHEDLLGTALRAADWIAVREIGSLALAGALGVSDDRLSYEPDDASFLPEATEVPEELADFMAPNTRPWIAVTLAPSGLFGSGHDARYLRELAEQLSDLARETSAQLVFLPHEKRPSPELDDVTTAEALRREMRSETRLVPVQDFRTVYRLTGAASLVVSSRYHPLVFGVAQAVPSLGIWVDNYTRTKLQGALAHVGEARWTVSMEEARSGRLLTLARELWGQRLERRRALQYRATSLREHWEKGRSRFASLVAGASADSVSAQKPSTDQVLEALALEAEGHNATVRRALHDLRTIETHALAVQERREFSERYAASLEQRCADLEARLKDAERRLQDRSSGPGN